MNDQTTPPPEDEIVSGELQDSDAELPEPAEAELAADVDSVEPDADDSLAVDGTVVDAASDSAEEIDSDDVIDAAEDASAEDFAGGEDEYEDDPDDEEYDDLVDSDPDDLDDPDEDLVETAPVVPVDWSAMAGAGAGGGYADVPDLSVRGDFDTDVDIDAALAAVDTLGAVVAADQERKREEADRRDAQRRADEEYRRWSESYVFRRPGMIRVQGGRVVTILPAVALMAVGAVLTLATASGQAMSWQTLAAASSAGLSVSLLSYWLASGRWARGALFAALAIAVAGAWVFVQALPNVDLPWRLPIIALGAAFALTGLLGRPRSSTWLIVGLGIVVGAVALPYLSQSTLVRFGPYILAVAVILAVLPGVFRTRRG